jgi:hypothetical protein
MATIDDKDIINKITSNKGVFELDGVKDPEITHIIEYGNMFDGRTTYCVAFNEQEFRHQYETGYFKWKKLYWTLKYGFNSKLNPWTGKITGE